MAKMDLTDIVFALKNKDYGAYVLRKLYGTFLSISLIATIIFFSTAVSMPQILKALKPEEKKEEVVTMDVQAQLQALKEKKEQEAQKTIFKEQEKKDPERASVKFTPPVIKPDELVKEEAPPSVEDLKDKNIGKVTREGVDGGGDIRSDANVDFSNELEEKKPEVVKEDVNKQKVEDNKVFTFAEEMPSFPVVTVRFTHS